MEVDHIFIFSKNKGAEAEELIDFGLTEGSRRTHKGQGTTNRKFYFENFFLELLWVIDEDEITQTPTKETQLWQRANYQQNGSSRFGLCLVNTEATDELFREAQIYQPHYFPEGMSIDFLPNRDNPQLPWTFRLPYRGAKKLVDEPTKHLNQIGQLTGVEFGITELDSKSFYTSFFKEDQFVRFSQKPTLDLILEFDYGQQQKIYRNKELNLMITY